MDMSDLDPTSIFISIFFGLIGMGYFGYGKKQNGNFAICGIILMVYPYVVSNIAAMIGIGIGLIILPFILSKFN